jgi:cytochrome c oxidase cbb3-type subunit II
MNHGPLLFLGIFFTLAFSWFGLVTVPQLQYGGLGQVTIEETGRAYPEARFGDAAIGREIYIASGCIYCHSQQVRPAGFGADLDRGWGQRRTVSRDYLHDRPVLLGTMRTGPDLTNIGQRQPSVDWHMNHLYDPQSTSRGSIMPPYRYLFERRRIGDQPSPDALNLTGEFAPPPGYEIVPTAEARALVAYLLSLKSDAPLPEAPLGR